MSQTIGARRGVGSVLTYRVFPGNKAGEKPWSHRKPYKPKSNRATSSKKPEAPIRAAYFLAPKPNAAAVRGKPVPASPPQRPLCQARTSRPVKRLVRSVVDDIHELREIKW